MSTMSDVHSICGAPCPHGGHECTLAARHGDNTTCSNPDAGPVHLCRQCNCTYDLTGTFHMHDGLLLMPLCAARGEGE